MDSVLNIQSLRKKYKDFSLRDVSITVPKGYVTGLVGPNGAGKTTVIKSMMNLLRIDGGSIRIFDMDHRMDEIAIRKRIGFVYDAPFIAPEMTVGSLVPVFASAYPHWKQERFESLILQFEIPHGKKMKSLSRGTQMKACIAYALSHDAEFLIMDEPTQGLDPVFRREFLQLLRDLVQTEGTSVLFSTHITSDLDSIADHVIVLHQGAVLLAADIEEIRQHWGVLKSPSAVDPEKHPGLVQGVRPYAYGCEALVSDRSLARMNFGPDIVIDTPTIEDVLYYLTRGGADV